MTLYYPTVNFLRGVAALMVCFYHFTNHSDQHGPLFESGHWLQELGEFGVHGVYMFFVISGFVIPLSLFKSEFTLSRSLAFLMKRFIRIEIPYVASIILTLAIMFAFSLKNNTPFELELGRLLSHLFYLTPFTDYEWYNPIYWTLAIEFQFYLVIGLIYIFINQKRPAIQSISIIVLASLSLLVEDNRLIFLYLPLFLLGINLFLIKSKQINPSWALLNLAIILIVIFICHEANVGLFALIAYVLVDCYTLENKMSAFFGHISYSLYLIHGVVGGSVLYLFSRYAHTELEKFGLLSLSLLISVVSAYFFWRLIENPSKRLSKGVK